MAELSKVIREKTSGKLEKQGETAETGAMQMVDVLIREIRGRWENPKAGILRTI